MRTRGNLLIATGRDGAARPASQADPDIAGKTILIYTGRRTGGRDPVHPLRPEVAAHGARVILLVLPAVYPVAGKTFRHRAMPAVLGCGRAAAFDLHCRCQPALAFATRIDTIPSPISYLPPPPPARVQAWQDRLGPHDKIAGRAGVGGQPAATGTITTGRPRYRMLSRHPRRRCDFCQPAEKSAGPQIRRRCAHTLIDRPHRRPHRFRRHRGAG